VKPPLLIGTGNPGKFREFSAALSFHFECSPLPKDSPPAEEDAETYKENALKKARHYFSGIPILTDDSGLEVDYLKGEPGVHSARYFGTIPWPERWALLLKSCPPGKRTARFRSVLCYFDGGKPRFYEGVVEGEVVDPRGGHGFGYDPIFFCPALSKTFGEATDQEKSLLSHRAIALKAFLTDVAGKR